MPDNPYYAAVLFSVGDYDLTPIPGHHLLSFSYERNTDSSTGTANKFMITLYDETAIELEYRLAQGLEDCKFQYGYQNGIMSKVYSGQVTAYDIDFTDSGVMLTVEGVSKGLSNFGEPVNKAYKDMLISDIVEDIAKEEGWEIGNIEKTAPVKNGETLKEYTRSNMDSATFINQVLVPEAKSAESNESGYTLYFVDKADATYVYFCTNTWKKENEDEHGETVVYEYEIGTKSDTEVISFKPEFSGLLTAVLGGEEVEANTIDALKNEMFSVNVNKDTEAFRNVLGNKTIDETTYKTVIGSSSSSYDEIKNIAANMWYSQAGQSYKASLDVVGNPIIEPQKYCSILVTTKNGVPHHSSGVYLIISITDEIIGGIFTSKLSLIRNGLQVGVDENGGIVITALPPPKIEGNGGEEQTSQASGGGYADIVNIALAEEGYAEGKNNNTKFGEWYGMNNQPWCAMFVSWCADKAGISKDIVPKCSAVSQFLDFYKGKGLFQSKGSYTPKAGDIFINKSNGASHTGLVVSSDESNFQTIEGNYNDKVAKANRSLSSSALTGFCTPQYPESSQTVSSVDFANAETDGGKTT